MKIEALYCVDCHVSCHVNVIINFFWGGEGGGGGVFDPGVNSWSSVNYQNVGGQ